MNEKKQSSFNNQSRTKNTIANVLSGTATQLLVTVLQFVSRTVFIRCLGGMYLGINGLFTNILTMLSLTELGLDTAINFKLYKPLADGDIPRLQALMKFYRRAYYIIGSVILLLGISVVPFLPVLIKDYNSVINMGVSPELIFILYLFETGASYLFFASQSAILKADQKMSVMSMVRSCVTIVKSIIQIVTLLIFRNFVLYTVIGILSTIILNLITARIAECKYPTVFKHSDAHLEDNEVRGIFKDLGALFLFKVNDVVKKATDNLVLSAFIGIGIVGLYANYVLFYSSILMFLNMLYGAVDASMGNLFATESVEKKYNLFRVMNYITVILFGTAAVGIAICANELLTTWIGSEYVITGYVSMLIGIEMFLHGLKQNLTQIRNASGVFRQMWYRPLIGATINLTTSIWLVQILGIHGVIIGTIASDLLSNLLFDPSIIYKYSFDGQKKVGEYYATNVLYIIVLIVVYFCDLYLCRSIFCGHGWISVIIHIIICALTVPAVFILAFYKGSENKYLIRLGRIVLSKLHKI